MVRLGDPPTEIEVVDLGNGRYALLVALEAAPTTDSNPLPFDLPPDAAPSTLGTFPVRLGAVEGTVTSVALPDWVRGVIITPVATDVSFAVNGDPAQVDDFAIWLTGTSIASGSMIVGNLARADVSNPRTIKAGTGRTLRLRGGADALVIIEIFG